MPTSRFYYLLMLFAAVLFACNSKKQNAPLSNVAVVDTVNVMADEPIDIASYNNSYAENCKQIFTVKPHRVSVITGKKGLKVTIDPAVLVKENGEPVDGNIKVEMIELTNIDELFKSNAATVSNGRLLASGGSYFIGMECNGQKLRITKGKTLQMQFPKIKDAEMELFYGQRNDAGDMNWISASQKLSPEPMDDNAIEFTEDKDFRTPVSFPVFNFDSTKFYEKLDDPVFFYAKKMTIKQLVDTINVHGSKIYIDTLYTRLRGSNFSGISDMQKFYRIKTCKSLQEELTAKKDQPKENPKENPRTLAEQLQQYYTPSDITNLGWINCDRFYDKQKTETNFDLPITLNKGKMSYFVMFRSVNGLLNGRADIDSGGAATVWNLPIGEKATVVAFTKNNGKIFHCKEEFIVQKDKRIKLDFKNISQDEMIKIFGKNVKI